LVDEDEAKEQEKDEEFERIEQKNRSLEKEIVRVFIFNILAYP
jgi:hypothetical protein